jgi:threonine aldolase
LKEAGVQASALGPTYLRLVTHMDVTESDISKVNEILPQLLQRALVA